MTRQPKTAPVAVYPDGRRFYIAYRQGVWWWDTYSGSSHYKDAKWNVEQAGGKVVRVPNQNYREPRAFEALGRLLGGAR